MDTKLHSIRGCRSDSGSAYKTVFPWLSGRSGNRRPKTHTYSHTRSHTRRRLMSQRLVASRGWQASGQTARWHSSCCCSFALLIGITKQCCARHTEHSAPARLAYIYGDIYALICIFIFLLTHTAVVRWPKEEPNRTPNFHEWNSRALAPLLSVVLFLYFLNIFNECCWIYYRRILLRVSLIYSYILIM